MKKTACVLLPCAVFLLGGACHRISSVNTRTAPRLTADEAAIPTSSPVVASILTSPRRLVGRVIAVDSIRGFAFVELNSSAPSFTPDEEFIARTDNLRETARLRATRHLRGRTIGFRMLDNIPGIGDEVVTTAP